MISQYFINRRGFLFSRGDGMFHVEQCPHHKGKPWETMDAAGDHVTHDGCHCRCDQFHEATSAHCGLKVWRSCGGEVPGETWREVKDKRPRKVVLVQFEFEFVDPTTTST